MSDKALRMFEVLLAGEFGARVFYGDEWTSDGGHLSVWHDDRLVVEVPNGRWIYIQDETSRVESGIALSPQMKQFSADV